MNYIFRWKSNGVCVTPSISKTEQEVWEFAEEWLRPSGMSDAEAKKLVHENGEVVKDE